MIAGHRTSVSLEAPFWSALSRLAGKRGLSVAGLIRQIDEARETNLSSALRVAVLAAALAGEITGGFSSSAPPEDHE